MKRSFEQPGLYKIQLQTKTEHWIENGITKSGEHSPSVHSEGAPEPLSW